MQRVQESGVASLQTGCQLKYENSLSKWLRRVSVCALLAISSFSGLAQNSTPSSDVQGASAPPAANQPGFSQKDRDQSAGAQSPAVQNAATPAASSSVSAKQPSARDRRRAAKLYLEASKRFKAGKFEEAMRGYEQAAMLDPTNSNYAPSVEVARNHAVTALIQKAAKDRLRGDTAAAQAATVHAIEINPHSEQVAGHMDQLSNEVVARRSVSLYEDVASEAGHEAIELLPSDKVHSFHLHIDQRQTIQQVFKAYGIETTLDDSVRSAQIRFDMDDASFSDAVRVLALVTNTFYVAIDAHRALVARDSKELRGRYARQVSETIYLSGLSTTELNDIGKMAKDIFNVPLAAVDASAGTITLRAPAAALKAFHSTIGVLLAGHNQLLLDVRVIQLAHSNQRNTGTQLPQAVSAFNVYSKEREILNANATAVEEIISSGLASADDPLAILGILIATGQVSSSLFANGVAFFGGGISLTALSPGSSTLNFTLNSSDSRQLENMQLRLGDGEEGKVRMGERYPIETSSYSALGVSSSVIAGLTSAGTSSSLTSLLSSLTGSSSTIPMIQYEDLGMTLKATPKIMRSGDVALTLDLKISSLSGSTVNTIPVLDNQAYSGVVTLKEGESVAVVEKLSKSQSRMISGTPGISEIPGLNDLTDKETQKNYATLLIVMTPHVIRSTQDAGHTPMMRVERTP
jgi:general secretion pathway protein D